MKKKNIWLLINIFWKKYQTKLKKKFDEIEKFDVTEVLNETGNKLTDKVIKIL